MQKIFIVLEKYSDWLESFSSIITFDFKVADIYFIENDRNDQNSVECIYKEIIKDEVKINIYPSFSRDELFKSFLPKIQNEAQSGDIVLAPYIRYRQIWNLVNSLRNGVIKVHLSESFPDTFGHFGYRVGYRKGLKSWISLPLAKIYALKNKPDLCFFPLYPFISNTFVKETRKVLMPPLIYSKKLILDSLTSGKSRPLLIGGFGYDVVKMAKHLDLTNYIATSKHMEIIIDGVKYPLAQRICAEEVLIGGYISKIYGYPSSVIAWAKLFNSDFEIYCYRSKNLDLIYGNLFSYFIRHSLSQIDIKLLDECKIMLSD